MWKFQRYTVCLHFLISSLHKAQLKLMGKSLHWVINKTCWTRSSVDLLVVLEEQSEDPHAESLGFILSKP